MLVSIVIPCYNHGIYLQEAIDSVSAINTSNTYEVIIINDGSNDPSTIEKLQQLEAKGHNVLHQSNLGLATARNNGIAASKGKYIIPLDSDNKLHQNYLTTAVEILEKDQAIDAVYANCQYFGDKQNIFSPGKFELTKILEGNRIDACAVIRKSSLIKAGGYDDKMPAMGNEDWELWINMYVNKGNLYYLDDVGFYYRTSESSMTVTTTKPAFEENRLYILQKHAKNIFAYYKAKMEELKVLQKEFKKLEYLRNHKLKSAVKLVLGKPI